MIVMRWWFPIVYGGGMVGVILVVAVVASALFGEKR